MNPAIIVAGFVVLLALLLYYMYKKKAEEPENDEPVESSVIKVEDYEAQLAAEKPTEVPSTEQPEEPQPEPAEHEPEPAESTSEEPKPEAVADDLESLTGIREKFRRLLRVAGVNDIATLAGEEPDTLLERLTETNETEEIVKRLPSAEEVEDWVQMAKQQGA